VATPATALLLSVPPSVPPALLAPSATVTGPVKLASVLPAPSCTATRTAGLRRAPATASLGWVRTLSRAGASATWKSAALSALAPNDVHALARPVWSTARACQW